MRASLVVTATMLATLLAASAVSARAQSLLERSPNLGGTWSGESGTLHFHFMHRFEATDPPARKVLNSPTFLLAATLPHNLLAGARYATNSLVRTGYPNEWEFFGRWHMLTQESGVPLDASIHGGWNQAASSADAELTLARRLGRLRVLGAGRVLSDAYHSGETRFAAGGGATLKVLDWLALAGDAMTLLDRADEEDVAWSAGVQLQIPMSPHTLSLHASNANTTTLQGTSRGVGEVMYGFEFTIPLTLSRYFGRRTQSAESAAPAPPAAVEVDMTNRLLFSPDTVRIRSGETVLWRNSSMLPHTVTADRSRAASADNVVLPAGAEPFDSGNIDPGRSWSYTFTVPGTYQYVCLPHELAGMIGVVVVEGGS
ncbi:MAG TPA: plastocyanin/azurin family copper-binding protein [Longimicrobiales bacterium]|nr:plastocyanin/azurin family copper-binding protein [Longimicrobiales bacterium]